MKKITITAILLTGLFLTCGYFESFQETQIHPTYLNILNTK